MEDRQEKRRPGHRSEENYFFAQLSEEKKYIKKYYILSLFEKARRI